MGGRSFCLFSYRYSAGGEISEGFLQDLFFGMNLLDSMRFMSIRELRVDKGEILLNSPVP
jgi:hypothetical protein